MVTNYCNEDGTVTEKFTAYHEAKAEGGYAMIITEDFALKYLKRADHSVRQNMLMTKSEIALIKANTLQNGLLQQEKLKQYMLVWG